MIKFNKNQICFLKFLNKNKLSLNLRNEIIKNIQNNQQITGIVLFGEDNFLFGSDLSEFARGKHFAYPQLNEIISVIEELNVPVVACMTGYTLGSGLELALGCHWRLATKNAKIGMSEISMGLIPSGGGTQRLPRVVGFEKAVNWMVSETQISGYEAYQSQLVDEISNEDNLNEQQIIDWTSSFLHSDRVRNTPLSSRLISSKKLSSPSPETLNNISKEISLLSNKLNHSVFPSLILRASLPSFDPNVTFTQGLEIERQVFTSAVNLPQCRATQYHYFTSNRIEKYSTESINEAKDTVQKMETLLHAQILKLYELGISQEQIQLVFQTHGINFNLPPIPTTTITTTTTTTTNSSNNITLSNDEILAFTIFAFINEGIRSLSLLINSNSSISSTSPIIDGSILDYFIVVNGLYPKHSGGPLWIAERDIKLIKLYQRLKEVSDKFPEILELKPTELLESVVESSASLMEELYFRKKSNTSKKDT